MERDYLDYDDWMRNTGGAGTGSGQGKPEENQPSPDDAYTPDASGTAWLYDPNATPPFQVPGQEWYWNGNQWTTRSSGGQATAAPPPATSYDYGGGGGVESEPAPANWDWPSYTAPEYQSPGPFTPRRATWDYAPFAYKDFAAPTVEQARQNPGYQFAAQEGINRLENSAAGRGVLRSGMTLKDIIGWGNKFADQNYDQVFNRELSTYGTNRNNAFDAYKTNLDTDFKKFSTEYGIDRDVYDRLATDTSNANNYRMKASLEEFAPTFDASKLEFQDAYNRWRAKLDAATQIATGGPA